LLLASPASASSSWVKREIVWWKDNKPPEKLLILLTGGDIVWNAADGDFDWRLTSALPEDVLRAYFREEPLYVDLRWASTSEHLSLRELRFRAAVLDISATLLAKPKDELDGMDVRHVRQALRLAWSVGVILLAAVILLILLVVLVNREKNVARSRELAITADGQLANDPELGLAVAVKAVRDFGETTEADAAMRHLLAASRTKFVLGRTPPMPLSAASLNQDGTRTLTADDGGNVAVWDNVTGRRLFTFQAHQGRVSSAVFDQDGDRFVTSGSDGGVAIWDSRDGRELARAKTTVPVCCAVFSHDGVQILSAGDDGVVRILRSSDASQVLSMSGHSKAITSTAFGDGDQIVVSASADGEAKIWNLAQPRAPTTLADPRCTSNSEVNAASFDTLSERVVTANASGTACIWTVRNGALLNVLRGHADAVVAASFNHAGDRVLTAGADGTARIWEPSSGVELNLLSAHSRPLKTAVFSPHDDWILTASTWPGDKSADSTPRIWNSARGTLVTPLMGHHGGINVAAFSARGDLVMTGSQDGTARLWDVRDLQRTYRHEASLTSAAYNRDGSLVITGGTDGKAVVWQVATGNRVATLAKHEKKIWQVLFAPDSSVVSASDDGTVAIWDLKTQQRSRVLQHHAEVNAVGVWAPVRAGPGASWSLVTGDEFGRVRVWPQGEERPDVSVEEHHETSINTVAFDSTGRWCVTTSDDQTAKVWDTERWRVVATLPHTSAVNSGALNSTAKLIATAAGSYLRIWRLESWQLLREIYVSDAEVDTVAFSPGGDRLAAAGDDGHVRVWSTFDWDLQGEFHDHAGWIWAVSFSPDGRDILTASADGTARIRDCSACVRVADLLAQANAQLDRAQRRVADDAISRLLPTPLDRGLTAWLHL
jgi:WD40 repeat protein